MLLTGMQTMIDKFEAARRRPSRTGTSAADAEMT
jgi:hypothetical protein